MRLIIVFFCCVLFFSCNNNKPYTIKIFSKEKSLLSSGFEDKTKEEKISEPNDSAAFEKGVISFTAHKRTYEIMKGADYVSIPVSFAVFDEKGNDVSKSLSSGTIERITKNIESLSAQVAGINSVAPKKASTQSNATFDAKKFKGLKETSTASFGDLKMTIKSCTISNEWTFDSYGDEWHYMKAERGDKYLVTKLSISSKTKDPSLPPICAYRILENGTDLLGQFDYRFSRWKDYGTYLGNYADYGNDFAQTETIPFSNGLSVLAEDVNTAPVIVVIHHLGCYNRSEDRFNNPPVSYYKGPCNLPETLDPAEAGKSYTVIKIFNRNKL